MQDVVKEQVLVNSKAETLLIRLEKKSGNEQAPKFKPAKSAEYLSTLTVAVSDYKPEFYYAGDCICWKEGRKDQSIQVYNLKDQKLRTIELKNLNGIESSDKDLPEDAFKHYLSQSRLDAICLGT